MRRLPRPRIRRQMIYRVDRPAQLASFEPAPDLTLAPITRETVDDVLSFRAASTARSFRRLLDWEDVGIYARIDGVVRGHAWSGSARRVGGYFDAHADEGFIHYCNVDAACRGRGLYPRMLVALTRQLFDDGAARVLIDTEVTNIASQRGLLKAGFRPVAHGVFTQLGGRLIRASLSADPRAA